MSKPVLVNSQKLIVNSYQGFTLVELLVVMAILGILVTLVAGGFRSAQLRGRDAQRKSDLKQISHSLELFYSDYGKYPSDSSGLVLACPYDPVGGSGNACQWGASGAAGEFTDGKTTYFKTVPKDPNSSQRYFYRIVPGSANKKFQIFARLENTQDPSILPSLNYSCGSGTCNFAVTSGNTAPTE